MNKPRPDTIYPVLAFLLNLGAFLHMPYHIVKQTKWIEHIEGDTYYGRRAKVGATLWYLTIAVWVVLGVFTSTEVVQSESVILGLTATMGLGVLFSIIFCWTTLRKIWFWTQVYEEQDMGRSDSLNLGPLTVMSWFPGINAIGFPLAIAIGQSHMRRAIRHAEAISA